jgi:hypothetical protein
LVTWESAGGAWCADSGGLCAGMEKREVGFEFLRGLKQKRASGRAWVSTEVAYWAGRNGLGCSTREGRRVGVALAHSAGLELEKRFGVGIQIIF